jgi:hypothetical protein
VCGCNPRDYASRFAIHFALKGNGMSDEASNVATLKEAYRMWRESKGGSVDHWMGICDENIQFGSIVQGAPRVAYMTEYKARDELAQYF